MSAPLDLGAMQPFSALSREASQRAAMPAPEARPPQERANILIVDDRPDKHVVFRSILDELEQNLVSVSSGEQALRQVLQREFAVILLDVNMPDLDGLETAALIRSRK